jgi:hypothetical protein
MLVTGMAALRRLNWIVANETVGAGFLDNEIRSEIRQLLKNQARTVDSRSMRVAAASGRDKLTADHLSTPFRRHGGPPCTPLLSENPTYSI